MSVCFPCIYGLFFFPLLPSSSSLFFPFFLQVLTPDLTGLSGLGGADAGSPSSLLSGNVSLPRVWLNETEIAERLRGLEGIRGTVPRWTLLAQLQNATHRNVSASTIVLIIDSAREEEVGIGRAWKRRPLGEREAYVSAGLLSQLGVRGARGERARLAFDLVSLATSLGVLDEQAVAAVTGDTVRQLLENATRSLLDQELHITVNVTEILENAGINLPADFDPGVDLDAVPVDLAANPELVDAILQALLPNLDQLLVPSVELMVVDAVGKPAGKWPKALGNIVMLEKAHVVPLIREVLPPNLALVANLWAALSNGSAGGSIAVGGGGGGAQQANATDLVNAIADFEGFLDTVDVDVSDDSGM